MHYKMACHKIQIGFLLFKTNDFLFQTKVIFFKINEQNVILNDLHFKTKVLLLQTNELFLQTSYNFIKTNDCNHKTTYINMLTFNFSRVFKARGINKPFSFLIKAGYSDNVATRISNNRIEKLNLKDVEFLCELLQCTPNDLIQWIPSAKDKDNEQHPLFPLKKTDKVLELTQMLNSVPLDKLKDIENIINNEIHK